jgi:hypothetical protein
MGTMMLVGLRLPDQAFRRQIARQLLKDIWLWTLAGLINVIFSGLLIFSTNPVHRVRDKAFQYKMLLLVPGIVFNYTIHRTAALSNSSTAGAKLVAGLSVLLWVGVPVGGI